MIGRYVDALANAGAWGAVDRLITAQLWTTCALVREDGSRCIRGWVHNVPIGFTGNEKRHRDKLEGREAWTPENKAAFPYGWMDDTHDRVSKTVPTRYNRLCARFGLARVVRAIKTRAGKHTRPAIPEQQSVAVEA